MDNNIGFALNQLSASIAEIQRSNSELHNKLSSIDEKIRVELARSIGGVHERIDRIEDQKLDVKEFEPYKAFFQKVNRLLWSILITAIIGLVFINKVG